MLAAEECVACKQWNVCRWQRPYPKLVLCLVVSQGLTLFL